LCDKYTGHPKGFSFLFFSSLPFSFWKKKKPIFLSFFRYAYVEFAENEAVPNAILLNDSFFRGRLLKVFSFFSDGFFLLFLIKTNILFDFFSSS